MRDSNLIVVGAGVIGLTSAIVLGRAGYKVKIITREMPENTTSAAAAAWWFPYKACHTVGGSFVSGLNRTRNRSSFRCCSLELHRAVQSDCAGQVLSIRLADFHKAMMFEGDDGIRFAHVVPRDNDTVLGGVFLENDSSLNVDKAQIPGNHRAVRGNLSVIEKSILKGTYSIKNVGFVRCGRRYDWKLKNVHRGTL